MGVGVEPPACGPWLSVARKPSAAFGREATAPARTRAREWNILAQIQPVPCPGAFDARSKRMKRSPTELSSCQLGASDQYRGVALTPRIEL